MKTIGLLPKIHIDEGSLQSEWKRCGKSNCRCVHGSLHGPYWYRHWREEGRQRKRYVPRDQAHIEMQAKARSQFDSPSVWSLTRSLAELRRIERELNR